MGGFVIFRVEKLRTQGGVASAIRHCERVGLVPNADPSRRSEPIAGHGERRFREKIESVAKVRKNAVLAVDVFLGASPEFFGGKGFGDWDPERVQRFREQGEKWLREKFEGQIVSLSFHRDEKTPHFQAIVVPIIDGKLNARAMFGGREKMVRWQDEAAEAFSDLGLARGVRKSRATHREVKEFYGMVETPVPELPKVMTPMPQEPVGGFFGPDKAQKEAFEAQKLRRAKEVQARNKVAVEAYKILHEKAKMQEFQAKEVMNLKKTLTLKEKEIEMKEKELAELREVANRVRALDLGQVLSTIYGAELERGSKTTHRTEMWETPDARKIGVTDGKWIDNSTGKGGRGAIDLVMHLEGVEYKSAVKILAEAFGSEAAAKDVAARTVERAAKGVENIVSDESVAVVPKTDPGTWDRARRYLVEVRKIPFALVDKLRQEKEIWSDSMANVVFKRGGGGAFLRGTVGRFFRTVGPKAFGPFVLKGNGQPGVALVESPIDALSLRAMGVRASIVALGGNLLKVGDPEVRQIVDPIPGTIFAAFDADTKGAEMAQDADLAYPGRVQRLLPQGKDWNEDLQTGAYIPLDKLFEAKSAPDSGAWPELPSLVEHDDQGFALPDPEEERGPGL